MTMDPDKQMKQYAEELKKLGINAAGNEVNPKDVDEVLKDIYGEIGTFYRSIEGFM